MNVIDFQCLLADLLATPAIPGLATVSVMPSGTVRLDFGDGARVFAKVAHVGPAAKVPSEPTWPTLTAQPGQPRVVDLNPAATSARVVYVADAALYLLRAAQDPRIAAVGTFAEVGAVGAKWPPHGLAVKMTDGTAAYVSFMATSPDGGNDASRPDKFEPAVAA